jgi:hypothetical protein
LRQILPQLNVLTAAVNRLRQKYFSGVANLRHTTLADDLANCHDAAA